MGLILRRQLALQAGTCTIRSQMQTSKKTT